jgi:hypothetical protein
LLHKRRQLLSIDLPAALSDCEYYHAKTLFASIRHFSDVSFFARKRRIR